MSDPSPSLTDPDGTREAIMAATYRALCEHGYAGLTIQRIAERFSKSKSLLYHHYDDKDELLVEFLGYMLDRFEGCVPDPGAGAPATRLRETLDALLADTLSDEYDEFLAAMVELRAQAAHDERYRAQFSSHDAFFRDRLAAVVANGVEDGSFREVDPDRVASLLLTTIVGATTRRATVESPAIDEVRAAVDAYIASALLTPEAEA